MTPRRPASRAVQLHWFAEKLIERDGLTAKASDFDHIETDEAIAWLAAAPGGVRVDDACGAVAYAVDIAEGKDRERLNRLLLALLDPAASFDTVGEVRDALRAGMLDAAKFDIRQDLPAVLDAIVAERRARKHHDPSRDPMALAKEMH